MSVFFLSFLGAAAGALVAVALVLWVAGRKAEQAIKAFLLPPLPPLPGRVRSFEPFGPDAPPWQSVPADNFLCPKCCAIMLNGPPCQRCAAMANNDVRRS